MRSKEKILQAVQEDTAEAPKWQDISQIHTLHLLEVFIDIRDTLTNLSHSIESALVYLDKQS